MRSRVSSRCWTMWSLSSVSSYTPIPESSATSTTATPATNAAVRAAETPWSGCARLTRRTHASHSASVAIAGSHTVGSNAQSSTNEAAVGAGRTPASSARATRAATSASDRPIEAAGTARTIRRATTGIVPDSRKSAPAGVSTLGAEGHAADGPFGPHHGRCRYDGRRLRLGSRRTGVAASRTER